jgi:hypothetical protein
MQNLVREQIAVNAKVISADLARIAARLAETLDGRPV